MIASVTIVKLKLAPALRRRRPTAKLTSIDMLCSNDKAHRELGHKPVHLRNMVEECYRWMVQEGRVPQTASGSRLPA